MNGSSKVKIFAVVIVAVLVASAAAIIVMAPSKDAPSSEVTQDTSIVTDGNIQSESMRMLMRTLDMCHFYIGSADSTNYQHVFGNGSTLTVNSGIVRDSVLLNSGSTVDFSDYNHLIMDGADLCIDGTNVNFVNDNGGEFTIEMRNGARLLMGSNIIMGVSCTLTSTPFTINYSSGSGSVPDSSMTVDGTFSINLDDTVQGGEFTLTQSTSETNSEGVFNTDTTYALSNVNGKEVVIKIKYDFTDYFRYLNNGSGGGSGTTFSFTDWFEYYFFEDNAMPEGSASFSFNGFSMNVNYEYETYLELEGAVPKTISERDGTFKVEDVDDLCFSMSSSNKDKSQRIYITADHLEYNDECDICTTTYDVVVDRGDEEETVIVDDLDFSLVDSSYTGGSTTILVEADTIDVEIDVQHERYDHYIKTTFRSLDVNVQTSKDHVKDMYQFAIQLFAGSGITGVITGTDYSKLLSDAVIKSSCTYLYIHTKDNERQIDANNEWRYIPHDVEDSITVDRLVFKYDYYKSGESKITWDNLNVISTDNNRFVAEENGNYVPKLTTDMISVQIADFNLDSKFKPQDANGIIGYMVAAIEGKSYDLNISGIETKMSLSMMEVSNAVVLKQTQNNMNSPKWDSLFNNDGLFLRVIGDLTTTVVLQELDLQKTIDSTQKEIGDIKITSAAVNSTEKCKSYDGNIPHPISEMTLESGISDIYCSINSESPKLVSMVSHLVTGLTEEDPIDVAERFITEHILDGKDLEMTMSLDNIFMDYSKEFLSGSEEQGINEISFFAGEKNHKGDEKAITVNLDLNAGNTVSKVGYHDSFIEISMCTGSTIDYERYIDSLDDGTWSEEYSIVGLNGTIDIDSAIDADVELQSGSYVVNEGFGTSVEKTELVLSNAKLDADMEYDKVYDIRNFINELRNSQNGPALLKSKEYSTLFSGIYLKVICDDLMYIVSGGYGDDQSIEMKKYSDGYTIDDFEMCFDYLNDEYVSLSLKHINSTSYSYKYCGTTDYATSSMDLYDISIEARSQLDGLNDIISYALDFMSVDVDLKEDKNLREYFNMALEIKINGKKDSSEFIRTATSYSTFKSFDILKKGWSASKENITSVEGTVVEFDYIWLDVVMGTTGQEQIYLTSNNFRVEDIISSDEREYNTVFDTGYVELLIGTDSTSLYKLALALYDYGTDTTRDMSDKVKSALLSFITDDTNTRITVRLTGGEYYVKDRVGTSGSEYKISITESVLEEFAVVIECSLKVTYTETFDFTMKGTYFKMDMAEDSKIIYSDSYDGNTYLEYFEFQNMDVAMNVSSVITLGQFTPYAADEEKIKSLVAELINVKGVVTADAGKYTSIHTSPNGTYYKVQIGSNEEIMLKADTNVASLMAFKSMPQTVFMESGESYIQSEYSEPNSGLVRQVFRFEQSKTYFENGELIVESDKVDASVMIGAETYSMKTDGSVYFDSVLPTLKGYSIIKNGSRCSVDGYGIMPKIRVDTFKVSADSVVYSGMTFIKGTELALTDVQSFGSEPFAGWKINDVIVPRDANGNTVYYAPTDDNITITYVYGYILTYRSSDGDDSASVLRTVVHKLNDTIDLSYVPTKTGFIFERWNTTYRDMPAYNLSIYAIWTPNVYKLTIDYGNGTDVQTYGMKYDSPISELETPVREGYTFAGWQGYKTNMVMPAYDLTIKAIWSKKISSDMISSEGNITSVKMGADIADIDKSTIESLVSMTNNLDGKLSIGFTGASISMSSDSFKKLSYDEITGKSSGIKISVMKSEGVSDTMLKRISDDDKALLDHVMCSISINVNTNGTRNDLGKITVAVPVDSSCLGATFAVCYISMDGTVSLIEAECKMVDDQAYVVFETDHFSYFALSQTSEGVSDSSSESSSKSNTLYYIIGAAVALIIIGLIVFAVLKRNYII